MAPITSLIFLLTCVSAMRFSPQPEPAPVGRMQPSLPEATRTDTNSAAAVAVATQQVDLFRPRRNANLGSGLVAARAPLPTVQVVDGYSYVGWFQDGRQHILTNTALVDSGT